VFTLLAISYNLCKLHAVKHPKPATLYKLGEVCKKKETDNITEGIEDVRWELPAPSL
jgi:hypothetical protein